MKNSQGVKAALLVSVIAVWGVVVVRVGHFVSSNPGDDESAGAALESKAAAPERYRYAADVRDPFTFVVSEPKQSQARQKTDLHQRQVWVPPPYSLDGIVANGRRQIAVVHKPGGDVSFMAEGDTLGGLTIRKIWRDSVSYSYGGKTAGWRVR